MKATPEIKAVDGPICPECGGAEVLLGGPVRPFKVDMGRGWESNCTACKLWFIGNRITGIDTK